MIDTLTFRFVQDDGSTVDETVDLDFSDVPTEVFARVVSECEPDDPLGITAALVHSRLSDPELATRDQLKELFEEMNRGEGIVDGG